MRFEKREANEQCVGTLDAGYQTTHLMAVGWMLPREGGTKSVPEHAGARGTIGDGAVSQSKGEAQRVEGGLYGDLGLALAERKFWMLLCSTCRIDGMRKPKRAEGRLVKEFRQQAKARVFYASTAL